MGRSFWLPSIQIGPVGEQHSVCGPRSEQPRYDIAQLTCISVGQGDTLLSWSLLHQRATRRRAGDNRTGPSLLVPAAALCCLVHIEQRDGGILVGAVHHRPHQCTTGRCARLSRAKKGRAQATGGFLAGASQPCGGTAVECLRNGQSAARQRLRVRKLAAPGAAARQTNSCSLRAVRVSGGIRWHGLGFQVVTRCSLAVGVGCVELGLGPARDAILSHQREMAITTLFWAYLYGGSSSQYAIDTQYRGRRDR